MLKSLAALFATSWLRMLVAAIGLAGLFGTALGISADFDGSPFDFMPLPLWILVGISLVVTWGAFSSFHKQRLDKDKILTRTHKLRHGITETKDDFVSNGGSAISPSTFKAWHDDLELLESEYEYDPEVIPDNADVLESLREKGVVLRADGQTINSHKELQNWVRRVRKWQRQLYRKAAQINRQRARRIKIVGHFPEQSPSMPFNQFDNEHSVWYRKVDYQVTQLETWITEVGGFSPQSIPSTQDALLQSAAESYPDTATGSSDDQTENRTRPDKPEGS